MAEPAVMLLTGTSRGIGHHLAEHYLARGWRVAGCSRSECDLEHPEYRHDTVDVADEAQVVAWVRGVAREWGSVAAAINNAGTARMNHALLTPAKTIDQLTGVNLKGSMLVCREAGKAMQRARRGRIVNFGSVAASLALEGEAVYAATKAAVVTYSRVLARELAPWNITVNVVAPLPVKTDLIRGVPEATLEKLLEKMVIGRYASFDDVANVVDFFLDPRSSMITGQVVTLGGW